MNERILQGLSNCFRERKIRIMNMPEEQEEKEKGTESQTNNQWDLSKSVERVGPSSSRRLQYS